MSDPIRVFVGWDARESIAYDVCRHSLLSRSSVGVDVRPIRLNDLRNDGLYWREGDPLASTEFTYSRFLTPHLAGFRGLAIYCDCDFLWLDDVATLAARIDPDMAVSCVQHDYTPRETTKMDGRVQSAYPRKNWSSLMVFSASHPACRTLTPALVNTAKPAFLHRMGWAADPEIGSLDPRWNWLEGWNKPGASIPGAVHFTRGGPWFEQWRGVDYADLWLAERDSMRNGRS